MDERRSAAPPAERNLLSSLRSLLVLGQLMTEGAGEQQILQLAATSVPSLAHARSVGIELANAQSVAPELHVQLELVGGAGGQVDVDGPQLGLGLRTGQPVGVPGAPARRGRGGAFGGRAVPAAGAGPADGRGAGEPAAARGRARHRGGDDGRQRPAARDGGRAAAQHGHPQPAHRGGRLRRGQRRDCPRRLRPDGSSGRDRGPVRQPACLGGPELPGPVPEGGGGRSRAAAAPFVEVRPARSRERPGLRAGPPAGRHPRRHRADRPGRRSPASRS